MPATLALALIAIVGGALLSYLYDGRASLAAVRLVISRIE